LLFFLSSLRKNHAAVPKEAFGQAAGEEVVVRSVVLKPTLGFQIGIFHESKSLPFQIQLKRQAVVSLAFLFAFLVACTV
jgi:hypothetical protein